MEGESAREGRAQLAFRIAGIAFTVVMAADMLSGLFAAPMEYIYWTLLWAVAGVLLICCPQRFCTLLLRPRMAVPGTFQEEVLRIGIAIIGIYALLAAATCVFVGFPSQLTVVIIRGAIYAAFAFLAFARLDGCVSALKPRLAVRETMATRSVRLLAVGLMLLGILTLMSHLGRLSNSIALQLSMPQATLPVSSGLELESPSVWQIVLQASVTSGIGLALAGGLILWPGLLASLFERMKKPAELDGLVSRASHRTYVFLALHVSILFLAGCCMPQLLRWSSDLWYVSDLDVRMFGMVFAFGPAISIIIGVAAALGLWLLVVWVVRKLSRIGGGKRLPCPPEDVGAALRTMEVGITIVALYHASGSIFSVYSGQRSPIVLSVVWLLVLALRGNIARLICSGTDGRGAPARARRASDLYPWLILLGVFFVARDWPNGWWLAIGLSSGVRVVTSIRVIPGIVLILGARWFSWWLSYDRLIPKIWPRATSGTA